MGETKTNPPYTGPKMPSQHPSESTDTEVPSVHVSAGELPAIHLRIHPVTHAGTIAFTENVPDIGKVLTNAVHSCWKLLYKNETHLYPRNIRSITIFVRPMGGVAYTTGNWMDGDNKEIHFSADYIRGVSKELVRDEIRGVLVHEMVHVWQHNGLSV